VARKSTTWVLDGGRRSVSHRSRSLFSPYKYTARFDMLVPAVNREDDDLSVAKWLKKV
jgi:hypothetical protein